LRYALLAVKGHSLPSARSRMPLDWSASFRRACMNHFGRGGIVGCQRTNLWRTAHGCQRDA
jgi:hypothetical protein